MITIAPSLLSADFTNLDRDLDMLEQAGADWLHCDVMDGVFVPNISFGFPVIAAIGKYSPIPLDVHLMIVDPGRYVSQVRDCGAMMMNVHQEACTHLHRTVQQIHQAGMKAGVSLNPATPVETLTDILPDLDMVLLMSVNPGFGGQKFIPGTFGKIERLRNLIAATGSQAIIQVDGGVNTANAPALAKAGVDCLVAGSAVFGADDPAAVIQSLKNA